MRLIFPKDSRQCSWTRHIKGKMAQYQLSAQRILRVLHSPKRREEGIASGTIAVMQAVGGKKQTEIWVMYQKLGRGRVRMVSAWRYPGVTKPGKPIPIPDDVWEELARTDNAIDTHLHLC